MDGDIWFGGGEAMAARAVEQLGDGVIATVRTARALAAARRPVDLAGLDNMIGIYCAKTLDLPLPEGRRLRARLEDLAAEIGLLEQDLAAHPA